MLVSVVIPTYNRREFVGEAVASVLAQTHGDLELIVVDDGSTDGTFEYLSQAFGDERLTVCRIENRGVSGARNHGFAMSKGEWIAYLDSDDKWVENKLERQLADANEFPERAAFFTEEIWFRRGKWANPKKEHAKFDGWIFDHCLKLCLISPSSVLMRRDVHEALGGWDETLPACEDYDLWLRLTARWPVRLLDEKLIIKRNGHEGQLSAEFFGMDRFRIRALWKLALDGELPVETRLKALAFIAQKADIVAKGALKRDEISRHEVFNHSVEAACRMSALLQGQNP